MLKTALTEYISDVYGFISSSVFSSDKKASEDTFRHMGGLGW